MRDENNPISQADGVAKDQGLDILGLLLALAKYKRTILAITVGAALIAAAVSLVLPSTFLAVSRIMPPQQSQSLATAVLGQLGVAGGLSSAALGLRSPSDLYVSIFICVDS
jgi:tyrosine-protein kinase Etk/Wzc